MTQSLMGHESVAVFSLVALFVLAIPVACITWTVTHEEILREPRDWCATRSRSARGLLHRKFFYVFTCEYCFSHYVTAAVLVVTRYRLFFDDWRGYAIAGFSLVWIANMYMSLFGRLMLPEIGQSSCRACTHQSQGCRACSHRQQATAAGWP